jgi:hypothetical protein
MTAPNILVPIAVLPPGTNQYTLVGLSPSTPYTVVVAHQEPPPSTGFTPPAQVSFTSSSSVGTCAAPDDPVPFVIPQPPSHGGMPICGFACYNNEPVPGTSIVVQMATETGVGSGTFGAWGTIDAIPTNPNSWCIKTITLQQDGLRRIFQAQAARQGCNSSAFTPTVFLNPATALLPVDYAVEIPSTLAIAPVDIVLPSGMTVAIVATYTPPTDHDFSHMEYQVAPWTGSAWGTAQLVVGSNQGSDTILAQPTVGGLYQITPVAVSTGEPSVQVVPGQAIGVSRNVGTATIVTVPAVSNAPVPTLLSTNGTTASFSLPWDVGTAYYMAYAVLYSSSPSPLQPVESPNASISGSPWNLTSQIYPPASGQPVTLNLSGLTSGNPYLVATFVPYNNAGVRGVATTILATRSLTTVPSAPTCAIATFGGTGGTNGGTGPSGGNWAFPGWVGIKVSFNSTPSAGDTITLYRAAPQVAQHTVTSSEVTAGFCTVVDETFTASSPQIYTATQTGTVSGGGTSAASTGLSVTLRSAYTLSGPTIGLTGGATWNAACFVTATMPSDGEFPPEGSLTIQYGITSGGAPSTWTTITTSGVSGTAYQINPSGPISGYYVYVQAFATCPYGYTNSSTAGTDKHVPGIT